MTDATVFDVDALDRDGASGAVASLQHGGDLDANVVVLQPGDAVAAHVNDEVDVLIVGFAGAGTVLVDASSHALRPNVIVHVPKGRSRAIEARDGEALVYLTVHRARAGLRITSRLDGHGRR